MLIDVYPEYEKDLQKIFDGCDELYHMLSTTDTDEIRLLLKISMRISRIQKLLKQYRNDAHKAYVKEFNRKQEQRDRLKEIQDTW